ncbi:DUF3015 domain-containing protein [Halomonadaceae bacterium KBTZ08]
MKKTLLAAVLVTTSFGAQAAAPGGSGCGWGNMLFEGSSGKPMHLVASSVNGTSGNRTFGITSGTNGCDTSGTLQYHGQNLLAQAGVMEEVAQDMAVGDGEALTALSVSMGVPADKRDHFKQTMHENFNAIFPSEDVTAEEVMGNIHSVMDQDQRLASLS